MGFDPIFKGVTLYVSIILEERPYLRDKRCWAVTVRQWQLRVENWAVTGDTHPPS